MMLYTVCRSNDGTGISFNSPYGVVSKVLACCATDQGSNPGRVISQKCLLTIVQPILNELSLPDKNVDIWDS